MAVRQRFEITLQKAHRTDYLIKGAFAPSIASITKPNDQLE